MIRRSGVKLKKAISILFLISCLLSTPSLITCKICVKASPVTLTADPITIIVPDNYTTIQGAINNASSGDTIFVRIGTYYEHVVINKTITLVGEDSSLTVIDSYKTDNVIYITNANNVTVKNFTVRNSGMYPYSGILIEQSTSVVIVNNKIMYNYEGINLVFSGSNVVSGNTILNNYDGIYLYSSSDNVFSGNTLLGNHFAGISLRYSGSNVFSGNTILNNYDGIYLYSSSDNVFSGNTVSSSNYDGIYLYSSSDNVFSGNTVSSSNYHGINLALLSSNNTIYHNNFNNTIQTLSKSTNFWDYGNEGNYWSDYTKQDLNKDGIGDIPYNIDAVNKDNYPLMGMFSEFNITLERETYSFTVISNSTVSVFGFQIGVETGNKIIHFNTTGKDGTSGFCRVKMPARLMSYPYVVLVDSEEIIPTVLNVSNEAYAYLYFTYLHKNHAITIISSKTLALYFELLDGYLKLNETYYALLENYNILLSNYTQLQISFGELNNSYQKLSGNYNILLYNYSQLQTSFHDLNNSYLEHLLDYSEQMQNIRNLTYILVALTAIFIITSIYLSKRAHARITTKSKEFEGE